MNRLLTVLKIAVFTAFFALVRFIDSLGEHDALFLALSVFLIGLFGCWVVHDFGIDPKVFLSFAGGLIAGVAWKSEILRWRANNWQPVPIG